MSTHISAHRLNKDVIGDPKVPGYPISNVLEAFECVSSVKETWSVVSEPPGEPSRSYLVQVLDVDVPKRDPDDERLVSTVRLFACSCPGYQYNQLPYPEDISDDPATGIGKIGTCKHGDEVLKTSKYGKERDEGQSGFESFLNGNGGDE